MAVRVDPALLVEQLAEYSDHRAGPDAQRLAQHLEIELAELEVAARLPAPQRPHQHEVPLEDLHQHRSLGNHGGEPTGVDEALVVVEDEPNPLRNQVDQL